MLTGAILLLILLYFLGDDGQAAFFPSYLASIVCLLLLAIPGVHREALKSPRLGIALLLIAWLAASPAWSGRFSWDYPASAALLATFLAGFTMNGQRFPALVDWVSVTLVAAGAAAAAISVYLYYSVGFNPLDEKDRLYALGRNYQPTISAISFSIPLIVACAYTLTGRRHLARIASALAAIPLIWAILLTGTRGAWLGLAGAAVASVLFLTSVNWRTRLVASGSVLVLVAIVIGIAIVSGHGDFILRRSTSFRPEIWMATLERLTAGSWLIGNGINVSAAVSWKHLTFDHAHSIYLSTLFYGGGVGLGLLLVLMLASGLPMARRVWSQRHAIAFATLAFAAITLAVDGNRVIEKVDHIWIAFWFPMLFAWDAIERRGIRRSA